MRALHFTTSAGIIALLCFALLFAQLSESYECFVLALVGITIVACVGLNILVGLTGQISLGHVAFYAIGAYAVAILTSDGVSFWLALPVTALIGGSVGLLLAFPALRVSGPYLAMVTIAFAFVIQHGAVEWRDLTGGANGLTGIPPPAIGTIIFAEREMAMLASALAALSLLAFDRLGKSGWGMAMRAVRDSETAARSIGLDPVIVKAAAFVLSAAFTAVAGGLFAPLIMFVAPDSFPFSQSVLFLFAVIVGGAGFTFGPVIGACAIVLLPELLSGLAEFRLLFFGASLLVALWLAPEGIIGMLMRFAHRGRDTMRGATEAAIAAYLSRDGDGSGLNVRDLAISFGGIRAVQGVTFLAKVGQVTSLIGANGAGKTTIVNLISGFYTADKGSIALNEMELSGAPAWKIARAGIARTYQTAKLFETQTVLENVLAAMRRGRLGNPLARPWPDTEIATALGLLRFSGYRGDPEVSAGALPHAERRLVEIARALATRPRVLLLDEPAAGLLKPEREALRTLVPAIAQLGIAVVLIEHDTSLVMEISDYIVVLDAGRLLAEGTPPEIHANPRVREAYFGGAGAASPQGRAALKTGATVLRAQSVAAGYGTATVLEDLSFEVKAGETVAVLGADGAGKSTLMRVLAGLLPATRGSIVLGAEEVAGAEAHRIARLGLALVPEGRQVFPNLSVYDNLVLGAYSRPDADLGQDIEKMLCRFPRLRERIASSAGLLSGGEQQMLAIARGLMANPRVLLLDEPSLGLAPAIVTELYRTISELRENGITILLVDQMVPLALSVADRGYVLQQGHFVRAGTAAELADDPEVEAAYLGTAH